MNFTFAEFSEGHFSKSSSYEAQLIEDDLANFWAFLKMIRNASDGVSVIRHDAAQKRRNWRNRGQRHDVHAFMNDLDEMANPYSGNGPSLIHRTNGTGLCKKGPPNLYYMLMILENTDRSSKCGIGYQLAVIADLDKDSKVKDLGPRKESLEITKASATLLAAAWIL
ncbi:hypothetical protein GPALN_012055 [Globodera pallida]|nr:hypothetical protein GPALN_012055 [Globodera pallida]